MNFASSFFIRFIYLVIQKHPEYMEGINSFSSVTGRQVFIATPFYPPTAPSKFSLAHYIIFAPGVTYDDWFAVFQSEECQKFQNAFTNNVIVAPINNESVILLLFDIEKSKHEEGMKIYNILWTDILIVFYLSISIHILCILLMYAIVVFFT